MEKHSLDVLNLSELHSLFVMLGDGLVDGRTTVFIFAQASGQYGHEKWKALKAERIESLIKIEKAIANKASEYDF